jgi:hypothetical protein
MGVRVLDFGKAYEDAYGKGKSQAELHRIAVEKSSVTRPKMQKMKDPEEAWKAYLKRTKGMSQLTKTQFMRMWYPETLSETEKGLRQSGADERIIRRMMGG